MPQSFDLESPTLEQLMVIGADAAAKCVAESVAIDKAFKAGTLSEWLEKQLEDLDGGNSDS